MHNLIFFVCLDAKIIKPEKENVSLSLYFNTFRNNFVLNSRIFTMPNADIKEPMSIRAKDNPVKKPPKNSEMGTSPECLRKRYSAKINKPAPR